MHPYGHAHMTAASRQRGVALITVLLVFALVALVAQQIMIRSIGDVHRTSAVQSAAQAHYYALGGEALARQVLFRDYKADKTVDRLTESWATGLDAFDIGDGVMTVEVVDLQGRFNVNNLVDADAAIALKARSDFLLLLHELGLKEDYAFLLQDWLDSDNLLTPQGGEDLEYAGLGYRVANRPMVDISELHLLLGMTPEDYAVLAPHVAALPAGTKFNLNTIDATIVAALSGTTGAVTSLASRQQSGGYASVGEWLGAEGRNFSSIADRFAVNTEYFQVTAIVTIDGREKRLRTQLHRDSNDGTITVLQRQQGIE